MTLRRRPLATTLLLAVALTCAPAVGGASLETANAIPPRCHEAPPGYDPVPVWLTIRGEVAGGASHFTYEPDWMQLGSDLAREADVGAESAEGNDGKSALEHEIQCGGGIPGRLLSSSTRVNMSKFVIKKGPSTYEQRGQAWYVQRDHSGHGGTFWKLCSSTGQRIASLLQDGTIKRG